MPFFSGGSDPGAAKAQMGKENAYASTFGSNSGSSWNALFPTLTKDITNPEGLSAKEKADMNTASSQSTGGSVAGAVGQGGLMGERTKNPGALGTALDSASKHAGETNSKNALGVEVASSNLAHEKQQSALAEMGNLYGTNVKGLGEMLDAANNALGTYESAKENQGSILGNMSQLAGFGGSLIKDASGVKGLFKGGGN
jgi:hypothetical protein